MFSCVVRYSYPEGYELPPFSGLERGEAYKLEQAIKKTMLGNPPFFISALPDGTKGHIVIIQSNDPGLYAIGIAHHVIQADAQVFDLTGEKRIGLSAWFENKSLKIFWLQEDSGEVKEVVL